MALEAITAYTPHSDFGGGVPSNIIDNDQLTACQRLTYFAIECDSPETVVGFHIVVADQISKDSIINNTALVQGSNSSTNGFDGNWVTLLTLDETTFGENLDSGIIPITNETAYSFYRISNLKNYPLVTITELQFIIQQMFVRVPVEETLIGIESSIEGILEGSIIIIPLEEVQLSFLSEMVPVFGIPTEETVCTVFVDSLSVGYTPPVPTIGGIRDTMEMGSLIHLSDASGMGTWWKLGNSPSIAFCDNYRIRTGFSSDASGIVYALGIEKRTNAWWYRDALMYPTFPYFGVGEGFGSWQQCKYGGDVYMVTVNGVVNSRPHIQMFKSTYIDPTVRNWGRAVATNRTGTIVFCSCDDTYDQPDRSGVVLVNYLSESIVGWYNKIRPPVPVPNDYFGDALAISRNTVLGEMFIVAVSTKGKNTNKGMVHIFGVYDNLNRGSNVDRDCVELTAPDAMEGDKFGSSLALNGDGTLLVVGSPFKDNLYSDEGIIYTYEFINDEWVLEGNTYSPIPQTSAAFGSSVALSCDGNILYVGSPGVGCVYRFLRLENSWFFDFCIPYSSLAGFGRLITTDWDGNLTCIYSNTKLVTYYMDGIPIPESKCYVSETWIVELEEYSLCVTDHQFSGIKVGHDSNFDPGLVFSFQADNFVIDTHPLLPETKIYAVTKCNENPLLGEFYQDPEVLLPSDVQPGDRFGFSMASNLDSSVLFIGAPGREGKGGVYVFDVNEGVRTLRGVLMAPDGSVSDNFGSSVSTDATGTLLLVGAPYKNSGQVYLFIWFNDAWLLQTVVTNGISESLFGSSVQIISSNSFLVGAKGFSDRYPRKGCIYSYNWNGTVLSLLGSFSSNDSCVNQNFGASIYYSGKVLAVGSPNWSHYVAEQGAVHIFDEIDGTWVQRGYPLRSMDASPHEYFGSSIAMNSQGTILAVGVPGFQRSHPGQGGVFIFDWTGLQWKQRGDIIVSDTPGVDAKFGSALVFDSTGVNLSIGAYNG